MAKDYNISKPAGTCQKCQKQLAAGEAYTALVRETGDDFVREDYCMPCWESLQEANPHPAASVDVVGTWKSIVPQPQEKKKLFVDNELLINFFERLTDTNEPVKISFRYVLALVLMRKKLLVYDRMDRADDGTEIWQMHFRGDDRVHRVVDPKMDEQKIADVNAQLGQILESEL